jgi:hypothetical protein
VAIPSHFADFRVGPLGALDNFKFASFWGRRDLVNQEGWGTKAAVHYHGEVPPGAEFRVDLRLYSEDEAPMQPLGPPFDEIFGLRICEADEFCAAKLTNTISGESSSVVRQAYAGLLWSKQFYEYVIPHWLAGDPKQPAPPAVSF